MAAAKPRVREPAREILADDVDAAPRLTSVVRENGEIAPELSCQRPSPELPVPHSQTELVVFHLRTSVLAQVVRRVRPEELIIPPPERSWIFEPAMDAASEMSSLVIVLFSILVVFTAPSSISARLTWPSIIDSELMEFWRLRERVAVLSAMLTVRWELVLLMSSMASILTDGATTFILPESTWS